MSLPSRASSLAKTLALLLLLLAVAAEARRPGRSRGRAAVTSKGTTPTTAPVAAAPSCSPSCANGGKCRPDHAGGVASCQCVAGWVGADCTLVPPGSCFDGSKLKPCPADSWCPGGVVPGPGSTPSPCPVGSTTQGLRNSKLGDCLLSSGLYCVYSSEGVCTITSCPSGSFCPGRVSIASNGGDTGLRGCPSCAAGFEPFSPAGATVKDQCTCVEITCTDGKQNGDETGVDCGGSKCAACILPPVITTAASVLGAIDAVYDSVGNLFCLSYSNYALVKFSPDGTMTTIKTALGLPVQMVVDNSDNVLVADTTTNRILKFARAPDGSYTASTLPVQEGLSAPKGIAIDGQGVIYIGDTGKSRILKVDAAGAVLGAIPTPGLAAYHLTVDATGQTLYLSDNVDVRVLKWDAATNAFSNYAGAFGVRGSYQEGDPAAQARFQNLRGIALSRTTGDVYVADINTNRVVKIGAATSTVTTFAGTGTGGYNGDNMPANTAQLNGPSGLSITKDGRYLLIADFANHRVRKVNLA